MRVRRPKLRTHFGISLLIYPMASSRLTILISEKHMLDSGYVDSLSVVILLVRIEEIWAVDIDDRYLNNGATTLNDLAVLIYGKRQS